MTTRGKGTITPEGCMLFVVIMFVLLVVIPLASLKHQNDELQTRIEELEKS